MARTEHVSSSFVRQQASLAANLVRKQGAGVLVYRQGVVIAKLVDAEEWRQIAKRNTPMLSGHRQKPPEPRDVSCNVLLHSWSQVLSGLSEGTAYRITSRRRPIAVLVPPSMMRIN